MKIIKIIIIIIIKIAKKNKIETTIIKKNFDIYNNFHASVLNSIIFEKYANSGAYLFLILIYFILYKKKLIDYIPYNIIITNIDKIKI
jgi:hypothetical protein